MGLQIVREVCLIVASLVLVESCVLSAESGPYPWALRIMDPDGVTITHGSLIKPDTALTICSPYADLPVDILSLGFMIVGYNFREKCEQSQQAKSIVLAENCSSAPDFRWPLFDDFALWTPSEFFQFDATFPPFLWRGQHPPDQSRIVSVIDFLRANPGSMMMVGLFADPMAGSELQNASQIEFISWTNCETDILMKLGPQIFDAYIWAQSVDKRQQEYTDGRGNYIFFCGHDSGINWNQPNDTIEQPEYDWYSGAAVTFDGVRGGETAIGMLSRALTVMPDKVPGQKNVRLISGFHQGLYEMLKRAGIVPYTEPTITTMELTPCTDLTESTAKEEPSARQTEQTPEKPHSGEPPLDSTLWINLLSLMSNVFV